MATTSEDLPLTPTSDDARDPIRAALECLGILAVLYGVRFAARGLGMTAYAGSVAIVLAVALATALLARRGQDWRALGFVRPPDIGRAVVWALGTFVFLAMVLPAILEPIAIALALPPQNLDRLGDVQHDTVRYLILLLPIAWGTAAFGEELVFRGFLNTRLRAVFGGGRVAVALAAVGQALLFGMGHAYLGPRGVLNATAIGLVAAGVYVADGGNLWPLIVAHGMVDSVGLTLLHLGVKHGG